MKAWDLHLAMPDRDVVMIVCNENGKPLNVPGVWYARSTVWSKPRWASEKTPKPKSVADIASFVTETK
jgi:hypothetical protein